MVWQGTRCMEWECGWFGKVPHVWSGNVDGLERCPEYGLGLRSVYALINQGPVVERVTMFTAVFCRQVKVSEVTG
jgi:hypothetical protein